MEHQDDEDNLGKHQQDVISLARVGHIKEDAEDVEG